MSTREKRRNILRLQGTLLVAVGGLFIDRGVTTDSLWPLFLVVVFASFELGLLALPLRWVQTRLFDTAIGGLDLVFIAITLNLVGTFTIARSAMTADAFLPPVKYVVENSPAWLAAGDINNDGAVDLVAGSRNHDTISILVGDGEGGFTAGPTHAVGRRPGHLIVDDLNRDGAMDLAVAHEEDDSVSLLFNDGRGALAAPLVQPLSASPTWLAAGDLDGDGLSDLVVAATSDVLVLRGVGAGQFGAPTPFPVAGGDLRMGTLADLDADGNLDFAVTQGPAVGVSVLLGDGRGGFAAPVAFPSGADPRGVLAVDVDGDGWLDLITANRANDRVAVLPGLGGGSFGSPTSYSAAKEPTHLAWGDFDGDCIMDLAISNGSSGGLVTVLVGDGSGGFGAPDSYLSGAGPAGLIATDVDADLKADLAYVNTVGVWVLTNDAVAPCGLFHMRRSTEASGVRNEPWLTSMSAAPIDDDAGVLSDGSTYFYVIDHAAQLPVRLSVTENDDLDTVRLGFKDGDPRSAPVDVALSSVICKPGTIPADGSSAATVSVIPRDAAGLLLGAGLEVSVDLGALEPGAVVGPIRDHGNGLYSFEVSSARAGTGTAVVTVEGLVLAASSAITFESP